ncbi:MAG TPA: hypothetical protein VOA87_19915 [Thermoanaerobaculia bacterium]|nr:hypothetical protein [Thermoanaerobaculia bacterium]
MSHLKFRRTVAALSLLATLSVLPALEAAPRGEGRTGGPAVSGGLHWSLPHSFLAFLQTLWEASGAKIDGNG